MKTHGGVLLQVCHESLSIFLIYHYFQIKLLHLVSRAGWAFLGRLREDLKAWSYNTMDFIEGLPKSRGNDAIWIVVDRLTKYGPILAPYHRRSVTLKSRRKDATWLVEDGSPSTGPYSRHITGGHSLSLDERMLLG
ncbi:hypothetical protein ABFS83_03G025800 [Erythranthe nasuta]